jgi:hypothetical protein
MRPSASKADRGKRINIRRYIRHAPYVQNDRTGFPNFAVRAKWTLILSCAAN